MNHRILNISSTFLIFQVRSTILFQTQPCENAPCPSWGGWSKWSKCSASCETGSQRRHRQCLNGDSCDTEGIPPFELRTGLGLIHNQHQVCNTQDCPMGERGLANVQIQPTQAALKEYVQKIKSYEHSYAPSFMTRSPITVFERNKETETEEKPMKWRHAWHNHCENSLSFTQKSKMGQVICNRQFCQLQCPDNTRYVDGKPRVSCTRFYDTRKELLSFV